MTVAWYSLTTAYRLHSRRYPEHDGMGAFTYGGRWNPAGMKAVYAASSPALATLEVVVNNAILPRDFVLTEIRIPETVRIWQYDEPPGDDQPSRDLCQLAGTIISKGEKTFDGVEKYDPGFLYPPEGAAVLSVRSAILPDYPSERNYVAFPDHPEFSKIEFLSSRPFVFDRRLFETV